MQSNSSNVIKRIAHAFDKMDKFPKAVIRHGIKVFLALFALGSLLVLYNRTMNGCDSYFEFAAISLVKSSFTILAEVVIGGLLMDYVLKK